MAAMALARGHVAVATVAFAGHPREALTSQFVARTACCSSLGSSNHSASQSCVLSSSCARMASASKLGIGMPRAAAAAATMAESMTRIADTFAALKRQGKVCVSLKA